MNEFWGKVHFWMMTPSFLILTFGMMRIGLLGMRRRIVDYDPALGFDTTQLVLTIAGFLIFFSVVIFAINLLHSMKHGEKAEGNLWNSRSPEWQVPTPMPAHNYAVPFRVVGHPFDYGLPGSKYVEFISEPTWIEPQVAGDILYIPVSEVENNRNVHFKVETQAGNMTFMAYDLTREIYVRANVCPPCQSIGFSLDGATLVCDRCETTFMAKTGEGISGACVGYPKASVPYEVNDGNIVMNSADLITAYEDTIEPGWP